MYRHFALFRLVGGVLDDGSPGSGPGFGREASGTAFVYVGERSLDSRLREIRRRTITPSGHRAHLVGHPSGAASVRIDSAGSIWAVGTVVKDLSLPTNLDSAGDVRGTFGEPARSAHVVRLTEDGVLDSLPYYGGVDASAAIPPHQAWDVGAVDVVVGSQGRPTWVGWLSTRQFGDWGELAGASAWLGRMRRTFSADTSFGDQNSAGGAGTTVPFASSPEWAALSIASDDDGTLWIGGAIRLAATGVAPIVWKYSPSGQFEAVKRDGLGDHYASDVEVQSDGRPCVAIDSLDQATSEVRMGVTRLERSAENDLTFGINGVAAVPTASVAAALCVDSQDRVIVAGNTAASTRFANTVLVSRFTDEGAVDSAFASGSSVSGTRELLPPGSGAFRITAIAVDSQDRIIVAGCDVSPNSRQSVGVARILESGSLDPDFGDDGWFWVDDTVSSSELSPGSHWTINALAIDQYDRVVVAGSARWWFAHPTVELPPIPRHRDGLEIDLLDHPDVTLTYVSPAEIDQLREEAEQAIREEARPPFDERAE